jgi:hypothetical protein
MLGIVLVNRRFSVILPFNLLPEWLFTLALLQRDACYHFATILIEKTVCLFLRYAMLLRSMHALLLM